MTQPSPPAAAHRLPANTQSVTTLTRVPVGAQTPPPLAWQEPRCPLCTTPVAEAHPLVWDPRVAWVCRPCGATWDAAGEVGRFES